jgi:hypothetical protein
MQRKLLLHTLRRFLFIQTIETPNPNFLKFVPTGKAIIKEGTYEFTNIKQSISSPLALKLFCVEGVSRIFYAKDYISVGKREEAQWDELKPAVVELIQDFFTSDHEVFESPTGANVRSKERE